MESLTTIIHMSEAIKEETKLACSGIIRTNINDPISEATPSCWYRRTMATVIRNGADHSP